MMRVTIIPTDGYVAVDGIGYLELDLTAIDPSIHAVQWHGESGWIEYSDTPDGKPANVFIDTLAEFQPAIEAWRVVNEASNQPAPPPTEDEIKKAVVKMTQQRLDSFARTRNYDGILSLCTYATSTNAKFQVEGQYGVEARDATWAKLYEILAAVEAGTRPMPEGYSDVEPELPVLEWPLA